MDVASAPLVPTPTADAGGALAHLRRTASRLLAAGIEPLRRALAGRAAGAARRVANVAGALFQAGAATLAGEAIGRISDENPTLVVPAGYAFAIWGPIYALSLAYAAYQALPSKREDPLLRRVGWWTAAAFAGTGAWVPLFAARRFVLAQVTIVAIAACLTVAFLRVAREDNGPEAGPGKRWLVAPTLGFFFGWLTAAAVVGFATTDVALGRRGEGLGAAVGGAGLLLLGAGLASAVLLVARSGPVAGSLAYAAAVLWALVAVVAEHHQESRLTAGAAAVAAGSVAVALLGSLGVERLRPKRARALPADAA